MCFKKRERCLALTDIPRRLSVFLAFYFLSFQVLANQGPVDLTLGLSNDGQVEVSLRNTSPSSVAVLAWETPFESQLSGDLFLLYGPDKVLPAAYQGRLVKRGLPLAEDFIVLMPGESLSGSVALERHYDIDSQAVYDVRYQGQVSYKVLSAPASVSRLQGRKIAALTPSELNTISISSESLPVLLTPAPERRFARDPLYRSCNSAQQSGLAEALIMSEEITRQARSALAGLTINQRSSSPRYLKWFGQYQQSRFDTVLATFTAAENVLANNVIEFNCDCTEPYFAFVYPINPFEIYLCPRFWTANLIGADSRAGTILHELSHFPEISGTDDHAYGASNVSTLAISDPQKATNNADSYEYFAENTPNVPIVSSALIDSYTDLAVNEIRTGEVALNSSVLYRIEAADFVQLTSLSGDADLFIYSSAQRSGTNELCRSNTTGEIDSCQLVSSSTLYVEVRGYSRASFTLRATSPNTPPVAKNDTATTSESTAIDILVLENDIDADGNTLSVSVSTQPGNGVATASGGTVSYIPAVGFTGIDRFSYQIDDGNATAIATITVTVTDPSIVIVQSGDGPSTGGTVGTVGTGGSGGSGAVGFSLFLLMFLRKWAASVSCRVTPPRRV